MSETIAQGDFAPTSLADILGHNDTVSEDRATGGQPEADTPASDVAETGDNATEAETTRDERGRFKAKEGEAAPPAAETEPPHVPIAALRDERTKRQALERQIAEMSAKLAEFQANPQPAAQAAPQPQPIPNPAEDPQGYHRAIEERVLNERLNISEMLARQAHPDMDDALAIFQDEAKKSPALSQQIFAHQHPWEWVYQEAQRIKARREIGDDPAAYRAKLEAEIRAQLAAEQGSAKPAETPSTEPLPTSLASVRGVGTRTSDASAAPPSLSEIVRLG